MTTHPDQASRAMDEPLIDECSSVLSALGPDKPWMTARGLARRTRAECGVEFTAREIEAALVAHTQAPDRRIRHSHYPSRKTLDLLWGHVDVVGEKGNLAELQRLDTPDSDLAADDRLAADAPWYFLSHNSRDFGAALEIRRLLAAQGRGAWLFETDIEEGGEIADSVKGAIAACDGFLVYVTRRSIGSLWVQKEVLEARRGGGQNTHVILDGKDVELRRLFANWSGRWPPEQVATQTYCALSADTVGASADSTWTQRGVRFMDILHEFVGQTKRVLAFPPVPEDALSEWSGAALRVEPLRADRALPLP